MTDGRPTVLVIDAQPTTRDRLCRALGEAVDVLASAGDVGSAVEMALALQPAALVMQVAFPGGGAPAVARALRAAASPTRALVYSAVVSPLILVSLIASGVERVIVAPNFDEFCNALADSTMREFPARGHFTSARQWDAYAGSMDALGAGSTALTGVALRERGLAGGINVLQG